MGTSTEGAPKDSYKRLSMFQWQVQTDWFEFWFPDWDWADSCYRRRMSVVAGISILTRNLGVGTLINRRTVITSANVVEPYLDQAEELRVWALGRGTYYYTPFRYRVWRARRVIPKSNNPEHEHGPRGTHIPRHDISIVHTREQMYLYPYLPRTYHYSIRALIPPKHMQLPDDMIFAGSGYEDLTHIKENYKVTYQVLLKREIVDCSRYVTKWWGKFICFKSNYDQKKRAGVPAGGPVLTPDLHIVGIGCFEIRYNEDRIAVFTDVRYYVDHIYVLSNITWGEYYDYAYQLYGNYLSWFWLGKNQAFIPAWSSYIMHDNFAPLGK
ncbi:uncharacterized protein LOC134804665 [Cydia splendana]|uniref:uncharacterized protein LOC134804665 n=1 Tax=Cydia splendana TaxID=1100963 RepID=UPI00300D1227